MSLIVQLIKLELEAMAEAAKGAVLYEIEMVIWNLFEDDDYDSIYHFQRLHELKMEAQALAECNELCEFGAEVFKHIMSL
jgi:hypothetical protein